MNLKPDERCAASFVRHTNRQHQKYRAGDACPEGCCVGLFVCEARNTSLFNRYCRCHVDLLRFRVGGGRDSVLNPRGLLPRVLPFDASVSEVTAISNPVRVWGRRKSLRTTRCVSGIAFRVFFIAPPCRFPRGTIDMGSAAERPNLLTLRERLCPLPRY